MAEIRTPNVSTKKLDIVKRASFDTLIEAVRTKSIAAQCTFIHRLFSAVSDDALFAAYQYAEKEIKRRAKHAPLSTV